MKEKCNSYGKKKIKPRFYNNSFLQMCSITVNILPYIGAYNSQLKQLYFNPEILFNEMILFAPS